MIKKKTQPSMLPSTLLGIAFGTAVGLGIGPFFSLIGMQQNTREVAEHLVDRIVLKYHPALSDDKLFLQDQVQQYLDTTDAVSCHSLILVKDCQIRRSQILDVGAMLASLGDTLDPQPQIPPNLLKLYSQSPKP